MPFALVCLWYSINAQIWRSFVIIWDSIWEFFTKVCKEIPIFGHVILFHPIKVGVKKAVWNSENYGYRSDTIT
jgi:hypothetical protein